MGITLKLSSFLNNSKRKKIMIRRLADLIYVRNNCKAGDESLFADAFAKGEEGKDEKGEITAAAVRKVKLPLDKFF